MVISKGDIAKLLRDVNEAIDNQRCTSRFGAIPAGYFLDVQANDVRFCPFRLEVTPFVFNVSAGDRFSVSDVDHDDFSFFDIAISIIKGRVHIRDNWSFIGLFAPKLAVELSNSEHFFMGHGSLLSPTSLRGVRYQSYLKSAEERDT